LSNIIGHELSAVAEKAYQYGPLGDSLNLETEDVFKIYKLAE